MQKKKKVPLAIFDIDGTVFRSSLLIEYLHALVAEGIFPYSVLAELHKEFVSWLDRKEPYDRYIMKVVAVHDAHIGGASVERVRHAVRRMIRAMKDRNYRFTKQLIAEYKKKGYALVTVSGSPHHVVEPFARSLGFDHWFGQIFEEKDGIFTGKILLDNSISRKDVVIDHWSEDMGFTVDYKRSVAVGDTEGDVSLLRRVGTPIAFNPNQALARIAQRKGWRMVVERKDVVYEVLKSRFVTIKA